MEIGNHGTFWCNGQCLGLAVVWGISREIGSRAQF